jgi:histidyl-tRNA synthetase
MPDIIEPRVLKGFRDFLPQDETARRGLQEILERVFRASGFVPIDTPALEYAEVLLGKGGGETDKQVYKFRDNGGRDVALRFDLTVPFARFMAAHCDELYLPFRRYHMAKVWRGENTQRGRYREFVQCDFDIVGVDSSSADADILLLIADAISALDVGGFSIRINHRGIFNRLLASCGAAGSSVAVLRLVDKLEKIGAAEVRLQLEAEIGPESAGKVLEFITAGTEAGGGAGRGFEETLARMELLAGGPAEDTKRLRDIWLDAKEAGVSGSVVLDPSITRGLDYYTGVVFETRLSAMPEIGSICSGGRYDELAGLYTKKKLPGVGASIGLDRLLAALDHLGSMKGSQGYTRVLVLDVEDALEPRCHAIARALRAQGIETEVFPERRKLAQQFAYAERKGIPFAVIAGREETERGAVQVKDLRSRESVELPATGPAGAIDAAAIASFVRERLAQESHAQERGAG